MVAVNQRKFVKQAFKKWKFTNVNGTIICPVCTLSREWHHPYCSSTWRQLHVVPRPAPATGFPVHGASDVFPRLSLIMFCRTSMHQLHVFPSLGQVTYLPRLGTGTCSCFEFKMICSGIVGLFVSIVPLALVSVVTLFCDWLMKQ